jgi:hypothetical protein
VAFSIVILRKNKKGEVINIGTCSPEEKIWQQYSKRRCHNYIAKSELRQNIGKC